MSHEERRLRGAATGLYVLVLALIVFYFVLARGLGDQPELVEPFTLERVLPLGASCAATVGLALAWVRPRNPIGWLISGSGLALAVSYFALAYGAHALVIPEDGLPLGALVLSFASAWLFALFIPPTVVLVRYPSGRIAGTWARRFDRAAIIGLGLTFVGLWMSDFAVSDTVKGVDPALSLPDPLPAALAICGAVLGFIGLVYIVVDAVTRAFRVPNERTALLWLLIITTADLLLTFLSPAEWIGDLAFVLVFVAIAIGVVFYGALDIVVNRALVYGLLTAILAGTYLASVLLLQIALESLTSGSSLAVAVSTLGVAALFRPARSRIQHTVDHRFFRSKYDAAHTLEGFGAHIRNVVDLSDIADELQSVIVVTMQPAHLSLWLRAPDEIR